MGMQPHADWVRRGVKEPIYLCFLVNVFDVGIDSCLGTSSIQLSTMPVSVLIGRPSCCRNLSFGCVDLAPNSKL